MALNYATHFATPMRIGRALAAADAAGILEGAAVFVLSDHGMEETDPIITGH